MGAGVGASMTLLVVSGIVVPAQAALLLGHRNLCCKIVATLQHEAQMSSNRGQTDACKGRV